MSFISNCVRERITKCSTIISLYYTGVHAYITVGIYLNYNKQTVINNARLS